MRSSEIRPQPNRAQTTDEELRSEAWETSEPPKGGQKTGAAQKVSLIIESTPTCYRAPQWPDPESPRKMLKKHHEKCRKNTPGPKFWSPKKIPPKYPENTPKNANCRYFFFGILGVFSWGSRISSGGIFFRYFSGKFRGGPSRGSAASQGVLNPIIGNGRNTVSGALFRRKELTEPH